MSLQTLSKLTQSMVILGFSYLFLSPVASAVDKPSWFTNPTLRGGASSQVKFTDVLRNGTVLLNVGQRCEQDNQDNDQAKLRNKWALECNILPKKIVYSFMYEFDGSEETERGYPQYPLFIYKDSNPDISKAKLWIPDTNNCAVPDGVLYALSCRAGCYTGDQALLTPQGPIAIKEALETQVSEIVTFDLGSSFEDRMTKVQPVGNYTVSFQDAKQTILTFHTASGGSLKVTENHPLINGEGFLREASTLKEGQALLSLEHGADPILKIEKSEFFGKVYNVEPKSKKPEDNIVISQGFLNGSNRFQNELSNYMGRLASRRQFDASLITFYQE